MGRDERTEAIVIREFAPADYDRVMELWTEGKLPVKPQGRDSRARIEAQVRQPNVIFLVAESQDRLIGTVLATHDGRKGWVNRLAVDPACRRKGVGRRLVVEAERRLAAAGMEIFACLIEEENTVSMRLFESLGYTEHREIVYFAKRTYPGI